VDEAGDEDDTNEQQHPPAIAQALLAIEEEMSQTWLRA